MYEKRLWPLMAMALLPCVAGADFSFRDDGTGLGVYDGDAPVLVYNYGKVAPPPELDRERWSRACYIHPLHGLDGEVLTQDFPEDHRHHRGIFWTWPWTRAGDRRMDLWVHEDAEPRFEEWLTKEAGPDRADVAVRNVWVFKDDPDPVVRETIRFRVLPADDRGRSIDFHLTFANVSNRPVSFLGAEGKGYGGFCVRPNATRTGFRIVTAQGLRSEDALKIETPWADFSSREAEGEAYAGTAVFQHPSNPGYPHPGWILRHYGFLGASWPHLDDFTLEPGESFELRYRVYVHRGTAEQGGVAAAFAAYEQDPPQHP